MENLNPEVTKSESIATQMAARLNAFDSDRQECSHHPQDITGKQEAKLRKSPHWVFTIATLAGSLTAHQFSAR